MKIEKANLFEGMEPGIVGQIEGAMVQESHGRGAFIFQTGEPAEHLYILMEGRVRLSVGGEGNVALVVSRPGDAFGWSSLVGRDTYTASAECVGTTTVGRLQGDALAAILDRECATGLIFYKRLAKLLSHRLMLTYQLLPRAHGEHPVDIGG